MQNIVQAEFFHVGGDDTGSLDELFKQMGERVADTLPLALSGIPTTSGIKTVVRYYDDSGAVTAYTSRMLRLTKRKEELRQAVWHAKGLRKVWYSFLLRHVRGSYLLNCTSAQQLAAEWLQKTIEHGGRVAVEVLDHCFRDAKKNELHELLEAARRSKGAWLFVFEPNDLLADSNKSVAHVMW